MRIVIVTKDHLKPTSGRVKMPTVFSVCTKVSMNTATERVIQK